MKKNYLFSLFVIAISTSVVAQVNTYVAGTMKVKVEENTLFYSGGDFVMNSAATGYEIVENEGNIKINGQFVNNVSANDYPIAAGGGNFINVWTDAANYGQVIIAEGPDGSGYLTMQKGSIDPAKFAYGQFAIPFVYDNKFGIPNAKNAFQFLHANSNDGVGLTTDFKGNCNPDEFCGSNRYYQSLFVWDNDDVETDAIGNNSALDPTGYYMINLNKFSAGYRQLYADNTKFNYRGIPTPKKHVVSLSAANHPYNPTSEWGVGECAENDATCWKSKKNNYGERHYTTLEDPTISVLNATGTTQNNRSYSKYVYQFGNPYTSNLDLSKLDVNDNFGGNAAASSSLIGIAKVQGVDVKENGTAVASGSESGWLRSTRNEVTGQLTGDSDLFIIKPFETFLFKFDSNVAFDFTFADNLKTFSNNPESTIDLRGGNQFYQLKLSLLNADATETYNSTFVVAESGTISARKQKHEVDETTAYDKDNLYTLQEIDEDDPNPEPVNELLRLYINGINTNYVAKPIYLGFNRVSEGDFVIKSSLYEGSIFNKLDNGNFSDGNKYLFYDSKEDVLLEITTDFEYTITSDVQSNDDRYIIYWNDTPNNVNLGNEEELANLNQTVIYGKDDIHKIRFAKDWKVAEVSVYDLSGKLITFAKDIDTASDYTIKLPTNNSSAYLVKTVNEKGEVVTKKIIKK